MSELCWMDLNIDVDGVPVRGQYAVGRNMVTVSYGVKTISTTLNHGDPLAVAAQLLRFAYDLMRDGSVNRRASADGSTF